MPQPKEGETQKEFVARCIPVVLEDETADDQDQAVAVCHSMWEKAQEGKGMDKLKAAAKKAGRGYGPICEPCAKEHGPLWQLTMSAILEEPCLFCEAPTKALHDLDGKIPGWLFQRTEAGTGKSLAVKMLREEDGGAIVGGYMALWGAPEKKDLQGDYFTPETWLGVDEYPSVPALFHHGLDGSVGLSVIGRRVAAKSDDVGLWVEDWLDQSSKYWAMVQPLLNAEALFYSPGSAPHLVKRTEDGELESYPIVEDTLTVIPAQHRLRPVEQIKAAYKAAGLTFPESDEEGGEDAGASCLNADEVTAKAIEILATINEMEAI